MTDNVYATPAADLAKEGEGSPVELWNPDVAGSWSILFTPLFGSIIVKMNWQALGEKRKAATSNVWIAFSVIALLISLLFGSVGFLYLIIWYFGSQRPQTKYLKAQWGTDYPKKSWRTPLLIAFGCWIGIVALLLVPVFMALPS